MKRPLNNEKNKQIKGKIIKSSMTFNENKPNFINSEIGVSSFETSIYEISSAWRSKNQTQFKANTNPIVEKALINISSFMTSKYVKSEDLAGRKTKPKQSQFKPKQTKLAFLPLG